MPPLRHDRWPAEIRELFAGLNTTLARNEPQEVASGCAMVLAFLNQLEESAPDARTRHRLAYALFDVSFYFRWLGQGEEMAQCYRRAESLWAALAETDPTDFEAHTRRAACLNHLGLFTQDTEPSDHTEELFRQALAARRTAERVAASQGRSVHPEDRAENVVCFLGAVCNLGHLFRKQGRFPEAREQYRHAINGLQEMLPKYEDDLDRDMRRLHASTWFHLYGAPHWGELARRFLQNAQDGQAAADRADAEPRPSSDQAR
jgi:tetratricopeptide (TPR) repeat protein